MESPFTELNNKWQVESATPTNLHTQREREREREKRASSSSALHYLFIFFSLSSAVITDLSVAHVSNAAKSRPGTYTQTVACCLFSLLARPGPLWWCRDSHEIQVKLASACGSPFITVTEKKKYIFFPFLHTWIINTRCEFFYCGLPQTTIQRGTDLLLRFRSCCCYRLSKCLSCFFSSFFHFFVGFNLAFVSVDGLRVANFLNGFQTHSAE